ncbi:hypothetical protein B0O99DRAFT_672696 [Bisporella sp. PMI_857]|nr:hypothetical protein B0O99DRAFT_672696 [Bisporella sp. PMI_857]
MPSTRSGAVYMPESKNRKRNAVNQIMMSVLNKKKLQDMAENTCETSFAFKVPGSFEDAEDNGDNEDKNKDQNEAENQPYITIIKSNQNYHGTGVKAETWRTHKGTQSVRKTDGYDEAGGAGETLTLYSEAQIRQIYKETRAIHRKTHRYVMYGSEDEKKNIKISKKRDSKRRKVLQIRAETQAIKDRTRRFLMDNRDDDDREADERTSCSSPEK